MIRTLERRAFVGELLLCKFAGNSGDTKPTTGGTDTISVTVAAAETPDENEA